MPVSYTHLDVYKRQHLEGQGLYQIPSKNCNRFYIGQSGRNIRLRVRVHELAVTKPKENTSLTKQNTPRKQDTLSVSKTQNSWHEQTVRKSDSKMCIRDSNMGD